MTEKYVKPQIIFEEFSLSTNIAAGCNRIVDNQSKGVCAFVGTGNIVVFDNQVGKACVYKVDTDNWDGFCYHVPTDTNDLFNS